MRAFLTSCTTPRFHEPGVEGVAKIVKAEVADARPPDGRLPGRLDPANGISALPVCCRCGVV
jgi:hypothetical protein